MFLQCMGLEEGDACFLEHRPEDLLGDVGLVQPGDILSVSLQPVVVAGPPVEFQRIAADHFLLAVVGVAEPSGHHAADVVSGFEQRSTKSLACRADSGDHAARGASVDDHVEVLRGSIRSRRQHACEYKN